jgi:hypothetical protein
MSPSQSNLPYRIRRDNFMMFWKKIAVAVLSAMLAISYAGLAIGAVSPEEAAKLGTTLTLFGAEKAGNKDGTIPEYTGGLTKAPANFKRGSGVRPDPFAAEKPLFSIDAKNMDQYADKLTEGIKAMMKKNPTFRIDVYKTHRTVVFPRFVLDNTAKDALTATTANGGLSLKGAHAGIPFPIPKDGYEVMWNHLTRYEGRAMIFGTSAFSVDTNGRPSLAGAATCWQDYPYYDTKLKTAELYYQIRCDYNNPARIAGEILELQDPLNMYEKGRKAFQYLPGLRRVKLAPELAFDTPNPNGGGVVTFDDLFVFCGSMERYNWKLIGKKEMYVPYNAYRVQLASIGELFKPKYVNPDVVRWELHRVWVVEATLRPGKRHIYHKRTFYVDEDSWAAVATESYDARGNIYKVGTLTQSPCYDIPAPLALTQIFYDLITGNYVINTWLGNAGPSNPGYLKAIEPPPARFWTPQGIAGSGIR